MRLAVEPKPIKTLHKVARNAAMAEPKKRITRMNYKEGPMGFLGDQIMKEMQRAGYAPRSFILYRSPTQQARELADGDSKAQPYSSAHQYYCAMDIIDEKWAWFADDAAPDGTAFWDTLWDCVEIVSEKFGVEFSQRLDWDAAHVQLANWRTFRNQVGRREPTQPELDQWFAEVLPAVWKQYQRSLAANS